MDEYLHHNLRISTKQEVYDANVKKLLSDKPVLAQILKGAVPEFKGCDAKDIVGCIEGTPEVGSVTVFPGSKPASIVGLPTEDNVPHEGKVTYDIRFCAVTPDKQRVKLIINVEAQNRFHPGYDLVTRGILYGARMLSSQLNTEFSIPYYDDIKKVYSIWICTHCPKSAQNTITEFHMTQNDIVGNFPSNHRYDLLTVVLVCLDEELGARGTALHHFLSVLLSPTLNPQQKDTILVNQFGFEESQPRKELLETMCNLSQGIMQEGIEKGIEKGKFDTLVGLVRDKLLTVEAAAKRLDISVDEFKKIMQSD